MEEGKWVHSLHGEIYNSEAFDTKEEAIEDGRDNWGGEGFSVGQIYDPIYSIDGEWVADQLDQQLFDEIGEASEDSFSYSYEAFEDLSSMLTDALNRWFKKHGRPTCFGVNNVSDVKGVEK